MTNSLQKFKPIKKDQVSMYVCGPTVYNYIHIGNARPIIVFDTLARYFKFLGYKLNFVQNFTDIDDKIINKSIEEKVDFRTLTEKYIKAFMEDIQKINILDSVIRPKVSDNLDEIIKMIQELIDKGYAYESFGDVFFRVKKFKEYGNLSNQKLKELEVGIRIEADDKKENPLDFVLWKKKKENEPYWESPWSKGRPGWHIECSALSKKYLGDNFDIHGGGIDLIFPHHENEIAQSKCSCNGNFASYWMHNGYVEINGEKMSKSLNNFTLLKDILKEFDGNVLRLFMLSVHYRKPINFSIESINITKKSYDSIFETLRRYEILSQKNTRIDERINTYILEFKNDFKNAIEDDLNTALAISSVYTLINKVNKIEDANLTDVVNVIKNYFANILGIYFEKKENKMEEKLLDLLNKIREEARKNKNYELSDMIRDELEKLGIKSYDRKVN